MTKTLVNITTENKFNIVTFVALVPDEEDFNGDVITADEIQETAVEFMKNIQTKDINIDHNDEEKVETFAFVESYIAPINIEIRPWNIIPKGSRVLGIQFDDEMFLKIEAGEFVWISIQWKWVLEEIQKRTKFIEALQEIKKSYISKETKKTLYVSRKVKNWSVLKEFAKEQWMFDIENEEEFHVTIAFSKDKVNRSNFDPDEKEISVDLENIELSKLGDAIVLKFKSEYLENRRNKFKEWGASRDFEDYTPHISLSYENSQNIDEMEKFSWTIEFFGETFEEIKEDYL